MKRQWLYHPETGIGTLFTSEEAIVKATEEGYKDTPAKCGKAVDKEATTAINVDNSKLTVDQLKETYKLKELKSLCKDLDRLI